MAFHRSRRWKSGSAPLIFSASSQTTDCMPSLGRQWNFTKVDLPASLTRRKVWTPKPSIMRKERGMARSDMIHMSMWVDSGVSETKSQKVSWAVCGLREAAIGLLLCGVDQIGKFDGVLDEEDGDVVADQIPVAFLGVELDGEAADIAGDIGGALVAGDGGEAHEDGGLFRRRR